MVGYILKRVAYMCLTMLVIITLTFGIVKLLPGTPYQNAAKLTEAQIEALNEQYGLNDPMPVQYVRYLGNVLTGQFGISFQYDGRSVGTIIGNKLPVSAQLGLEAVIVGTLFGIILGAIAALRKGGALDYGTTLFAVLGISVPSFIFAMLLQYVFALKLNILPLAYWTSWQNHVLPVISLAVGFVAIIARYMRTELVEVMGSDYIVTAKAKGLKRSTVITKHSIRNALIPIVTIVGPATASIVTGSLVIEQIFAIPGIGDAFVNAIFTNDYPVIMGTTILFALFFVIAIFLTDLVYGIIDPRIRLAGGDS
ncbi:ABC transporter permease [Virgibacillus siamensis]|uniref:ABC transporter permease n=1 Tax=Virgibacillus siamensis TaxID=480071 RepID=UPI001115A4A4|nr:ABC transporter permease [Virgibacillus siamensis]